MCKKEISHSGLARDLLQDDAAVRATRGGRLSSRERKGFSGRSDVDDVEV